MMMLSNIITCVGKTCEVEGYGDITSRQYLYEGRIGITTGHYRNNGCHNECHNSKLGAYAGPVDPNGVDKDWYLAQGLAA